MTTLFETQSEACAINPQASLFGTFLPRTRRVLKQYDLFHFSFLILTAFEVFCCLIFFNLMTQSHLVAITLSVFLMTLFSYFTLKIYLGSKKPQQLLLLCQETLEELKQKSEPMQDEFEKQLFIASSLTRLANALKDCEYHFYQTPRGLHALRHSFEKLSCWLHWKDFHLIKEWLYFHTIEIYILLIKEQPDHLQLHMALANTYVMFSAIFSSPKNEDFKEQARWVPASKLSSEFGAKFLLCAKRAIEEFKILNDYNPNDPWVHNQLAYSYHDLQMPEEEIKAYEKIIELSPLDYDSFYKLGTLYFQQGFIAKGLKIYEHLKHEHPSKAASLIKHYGNFSEGFSFLQLD